MAKRIFTYSLQLLLQTDKVFFGPEMARLLRLVEITGSLQKAAAEMKISYSKAWKMMREAEKEAGFAMLERHVGGAGGGSSQLTAKGHDFVQKYDDFERAIYKTSDKLFAEYFGK